jgi:hypothetical protein
MLAKVKDHGMKRRILIFVKHLLLLHQLQSQLLRLLHAHRKVTATRSHIPLIPPIPSLRRDIRRRDNPDIRIYKEQRENLAMARLTWVCEPERLHAMLQDVWEESSLAEEDVAKLLDAGFAVFAAVDGLEPVVLP